MRTREQIEKALDASRLSVVMSNGRCWKARRNGQTKLWKTRPNDFRIPIKMGLKSYGVIDQNNMQSPEIVIEPE